MRRQEFDASFEGTIKRKGERNIHRGAVFIKTAFIFDRSEIQWACGNVGYIPLCVSFSLGSRLDSLATHLFPAATNRRSAIALCTHSRKFLLPLPRHHLTPHPPYSFILLFDPTSDELGCCLRLYSLVHSLFSNLFFLSVFRSTVASFPHHLYLSLRSDSLRD